MKTIKIIGISITVLIVLIVIVSYFLPRKVTIEREISINSSKNIIFEQVNNLKNWENWVTWFAIDANAVFTYSDTISGKGANYSWKSEHKNVGNGSIAITESIPLDSIAYQLGFENQGTSAGYFKFIYAENDIIVKWSMISDARFNPVARYFNLFMDKVMGNDFEKGLENLKTLCENQKTDFLKIEDTSFAGFRYIAILDSCATSEIGNKTTQIFTELMDFMEKNKIDCFASPISVYYSHTFEKIVFETGFPIRNEQNVSESERVKIKQMPASEVALAHYYGSYDLIYTAYIELENWFKDNNKTEGNYAWEEYITDPSTQPDTAKWYTKVYYPVK